MNYQLIKPSVKYIDSYIGAITEGPYTPMQGDFGMVTAKLVKKDSQSFINYINSKPPISMSYLGRQYSILNHELFWVVSSKQFIASVAMRYDHNCLPLTEAYGHMGLSARPFLVNKGGAAKAYIRHLPTLCGKFKDKGFKQITLSCGEDNLPSKRLIEHTGGIFNGKKKLTTGTMLIYKLDLV